MTNACMVCIFLQYSNYFFFSSLDEVDSNNGKRLVTENDDMLMPSQLVHHKKQNLTIQVLESEVVNKLLLFEVVNNNSEHKFSSSTISVDKCSGCENQLAVTDENCEHDGQILKSGVNFSLHELCDDKDDEEPELTYHSKSIVASVPVPPISGLGNELSCKKGRRHSDVPGRSFKGQWKLNAKKMQYTDEIITAEKNSGTVSSHKNNDVRLHTYEESMRLEPMKLPPIIKSPAKAKRIISPLVPTFDMPQSSASVFPQFSKHAFPFQLKVLNVQKQNMPEHSTILMKKHKNSLADESLQISLSSRQTRSNFMTSRIKPTDTVSKSQNFLQLSPSNGGAMSYISAMKKISLKNELHDPKNQQWKDNSASVFYQRGNEDHPITRKSFSTIDNISQKQLNEYSTVDTVQGNIPERENKLRRKQIKKQATLLEIEEQKDFDDNPVVKYDVDEKMKALVHKLRGIKVVE